MSGKGWRITFVDTTALLFVFLVLLGMAPDERIVPAAAPHDARARARPVKAAGAGMLAAMAHSAAEQGRFGDAVVRAVAGRVTIDRALPVPVDAAALEALLHAAASITRGQGPVAIDVTLEVPTTDLGDTLGTLQRPARRWPGRWLVRTGAGRGARLMLMLEPRRG